MVEIRKLLNQPIIIKKTYKNISKPIPKPNPINKLYYYRNDNKLNLKINKINKTLYFL
tara:strand:- start:3474 stop:3647 length:174 start_codon:yes stop_codon:yes gene_type:complete